MENILKNFRENLENEHVITEDLLCKVITQFMKERNMKIISIIGEIKDKKTQIKIMGG